MKRGLFMPLAVAAFGLVLFAGSTLALPPGYPYPSALPPGYPLRTGAGKAAVVTASPLASAGRTFTFKAARFNNVVPYYTYVPYYVPYYAPAVDGYYSQDPLATTTPNITINNYIYPPQNGNPAQQQTGASQQGPLSDEAINAQLASISALSSAGQAYPAVAASRPQSTAAAAGSAASLRTSGFLPNSPGFIGRGLGDDRHFRRHFLWNDGHMLILGDDDLSPAYPDGSFNATPYGDTFDGAVVAQVQQMLKAQGYYDGPMDGAVDPGLRRSIGDYQSDHKLAANGVIDEALLASLGLLRGASSIN